MPHPHTTRTLGPIHFEDLEPKRFEDLVRELIYDFKDWQSIEATGRGGNDDGFDVRAYERGRGTAIEVDGEDAEVDTSHPMDGKVWMIQCKRESALGPSRVKDIIAEGVDPESPPYGYVLVAPANFSKTSFDTFREELRTRGVMEFYLWGRASLEDMLHLPKNDHILFTFFGISLVSRRRSRSTEIRSTVATKNKLLKLLGTNPSYSPVLFRDINDTHYPFKDEYKDFNEQPRWREFPVVDMHPLGLVVQVREHFAYCDPETKEWDYTEAVNLIRRQSDEERGDDDKDLKKRVKEFWEFLPRSHQAKYISNALVRYGSIAVIDSEGDSANAFPHIYTEFKANRGPFYWFWDHRQLDEHRSEKNDDEKRVSKFPEIFPKQNFGTIHRERSLQLDQRTSGFIKNHSSWLTALYDCDGKFDFLNPGDVIGITGTGDRNTSQTLIKITHKRQESAEAVLNGQNGTLMGKQNVEEQIGRPLAPKDTITIYEFKIVYDWQLQEDK